MRAVARKIMPLSMRRWLSRRLVWPPGGAVRFGSLRRLTPISKDWGFDRGTPVDRFYIERFLAANAHLIRGRVLEIDTPRYTEAFGGDRVTRSDVLHVADRKPGVTIVGDLRRADHIESDSFDCVILTQTLQTIFEVEDVLATVARILKPGGSALITVPGISKISRADMDRWGYYWSFTSLCARRLVEESFEPPNVEVGVHGNVLTAIAFLHGVSASELTKEELNHHDPDYEVLITVVARK